MNQMDWVRTVNYTLDNCGKRTQVVDAGVTKTYTPHDLNQYTTGHSMAVTNGPSHEISSFNGTNYSYIADKLPVESDQWQQQLHLFYNALSRCVKRTTVTNGGTAVDYYYIFDGEHWIVEWSGWGRRDIDGQARNGSGRVSGKRTSQYDASGAT